MSVRIQYRLGISGTREAIWEVIADLPNWGAWNPLYPKATGAIGFGATLRLEEHAPPHPPRNLVFKVTDWGPGEHLYMRAPAGLLTTRLQYIELEAVADKGCIVAAGVIFNGMGEGGQGRANRHLREGFTAMLEGMKAKVEGGA